MPHPDVIGWCKNSPIFCRISWNDIVAPDLAGKRLALLKEVVLATPLGQKIEAIERRRMSQSGVASSPWTATEVTQKGSKATSPLVAAIHTLKNRRILR